MERRVEHAQMKVKRPPELPSTNCAQKVNEWPCAPNIPGLYERIKGRKSLRINLVPSVAFSVWSLCSALRSWEERLFQFVNQAEGEKAVLKKSQNWWIFEGTIRVDPLQRVKIVPKQCQGENHTGHSYVSKGGNVCFVFVNTYLFIVIYFCLLKEL